MTSSDHSGLAALARLGEQFDGLAAAPGGRGSRGRLAVALAATLIALTAFSFTPPGRAATGWVAERFGAGEPGGSPTLKEFREFTTEGTIADGVPAHIIATGPAPYGLTYELITFRSKADGMFCFEVDLVKQNGGPSGSWGGGCGQVPEEGGLRLDGGGGNAGPEEPLLMALGRVSSDVAAVEVDFAGKVREAQLQAVDEDLAADLGFDHPFGVFAAFFTDRGDGGRLTITAEDEDGDVVAAQRRYLPDPWSHCELLPPAEAERYGCPSG